MPTITPERRAAGALRRAARSAGITDTFVDGLGVRRRASVETLAALLDALGQSKGAAGSSPPPPAVMRAGASIVRLGRSAAQPAALCLDTGETLDIVRREAARGDRPRATLRLSAPAPVGVHRLIDARGELVASVLAAPRSLRPIVESHGRRLALFLPLYSARSSRNWGVGDYTGLADLVRWANAAADADLGTLPLFPSFLSDPFDPSPYAPVSRLFWSELFVDPEASPEFAALRAARPDRVSRWRRRAARLRAAHRVDHKGCMALKMEALRELAAIARRDPRREAEVRRECDGSPELAAYARFRAAVETEGGDWRGWGTGASIPDTPALEDAAWVWLYTQHLAAAEMRRLAAAAGGRSPLYLDLPVGVHPGGFDTWRWPGHFLLGVSAGAPPDALYAAGQDWSFPPAHPAGARADGYAHLRAVLRRVLSAAGVIRIDHVMGLHRMYCIPPGFRADQGAYLRYPADELYAVLMIEAHRAGALVVGENLGTVPHAVNARLKRAGILGMHVQQFRFGGRPSSAVRPPAAWTMASLNTHDTPTFAAFWSGGDIKMRRRTGMISGAAAASERRARTNAVGAARRWLGARAMPSSGTAPAFRSLSLLHAAGPSPYQVVNLEDCWGERQPQNVPGIVRATNWTRCAARTLEQIVGDRKLASFVGRLAAARAAPARTPRPARSRRR